MCIFVNGKSKKKSMSICVWSLLGYYYYNTLLFITQMLDNYYYFSNLSFIILYVTLNLIILC